MGPLIQPIVVTLFTIYSLMAAEAEAVLKWEGKVSARLTKASTHQIWELYRDFFNLSTCYGVLGINGEPGCIRYCAGSSIPSSNGHKLVNWSQERLISADEAGHRLCYEIVDSNIGFNSYVSTVQILPGDHDCQHGCVIEWSFTVDPVVGWVLDDLVNKYHVGLQRMTQRMEDALAN